MTLTFKWDQGRKIFVQNTESSQQPVNNIDNMIFEIDIYVNFVIAHYFAEIAKGGVQSAKWWHAGLFEKQTLVHPW